MPRQGRRTAAAVARPRAGPPMRVQPRAGRRCPELVRLARAPSRDLAQPKVLHLDECEDRGPVVHRRRVSVTIIVTDTLRCSGVT